MTGPSLPQQVCMLLFNNLETDPRVFKEAITLAEAGYAVDILAVRIKGKSVRDKIAEDATVKRIFPYCFVLTAPHKLLCNIAAIGKYALLNRGKLSYIHCHDAETLPYGFFLKLFNRRAKIIYDAHEYIQSYLPLPEKVIKRIGFAFTYRLHSLYERLFIRKVNAVVSVAESLVERLVRDYSLTCRSLCIYNSLEAARATKEYLARACDERGLKKVIVFSGTLDPSREIENLLDVLGYLGREYCLALLGRWSTEGYRAKIYQCITDRGLTGQVIEAFIPYQDLTAVLSEATFSMFISTPSTVTLQYSMPNKLWESIAAGVPFVANSALVEISRFIRKHGVGIVVDSHDPGLIAQEILRVVSSGEYEMIKAKVQRVREAVGWNCEQQKLIDLYKGLA